MLHKKTFLITGASNGIGFELVKMATDKGHNVIAISRNTSNLKSIKGVNVFSVDITDEKSLKSFTNRLIKQKIK